jgi:hypothetical protein
MPPNGQAWVEPTLKLKFKLRGGIWWNTLPISRPRQPSFYRLSVAGISAYISAPVEVVGVQTDTLTFAHCKETRHYTRFICVAYHIPPHFLGAVGDIFLTGAEPTTWVRTQHGWKVADKTTEEDGVPRETHPQFSAYIRLDPSDAKWKGTRTFRPKISRRAQKATATQEEGESMGFGSLTWTK